MQDAPASQRSRGMRDLLPDEMDRLRAVEGAFAAACRAWGYREIRTPVIEPLHLFTRAGTLSPQTLDRVYSFLDWDGWSGERVVLRPDSTIPAARLYAEHLDGGRVAKLWYSQDVFRFTDDGSSREEWQCGVELIGDTGATGDVELVLLAIEALRPLGIEGLTLRLSHAGIVRAVLAEAGLSAQEQSAAYDRLLDGDATVVGDVESLLPQLNAPLRLLFEVEGAGSGYLQNVRSTLGTAMPSLTPALDELALIVAALEARGATPVIEAVLARSFEYYSGLVMQIDVGGQRVCAGGRYDGLLSLVGTSDVPASGFGLYLLPLMDALPGATVAAKGPQVTVRPRTSAPDDLAAAFAAAERLRAAGVQAEVTEGMHSASTHWLTCDAKSRFGLRTGADEEIMLAAIEDVVVELEPGR